MRMIAFVMTMLLLVSCAPALPAATADAELETPSRWPSVTPWPTVTPSSWPTQTARPTITPYAGNAVDVPYDPSGWTLLYDRDHAPSSIAIDLQKRMWSIVEDQVSHFDGTDWVPLSNDRPRIERFGYLLPSPDGSVWLTGKSGDVEMIAHYQSGRWETYAMPVDTTSALVYPGIDSSGRLWLSLDFCSYCTKAIFLYSLEDGIWIEHDSPVHDRRGGGVKLLSDSKGRIWVYGSWSTGIARLDGGDWHTYSGESLWPEGPSQWGFDREDSIQLEAGRGGAVLAYMMSSDPAIIQIGVYGDISRIPIDVDRDFYGITWLIMSEDSQGRLWFGMDRWNILANNVPTTLAYYDGTRWHCSTDLPFSVIYQIVHAPDGGMWVWADQEWYRYEPPR